MKLLSLILIILNLGSCSLAGSHRTISPDQQEAINQKIQVTISEIVEPLFATIESACGYRKEYNKWPELDSQKESIENFEIITISTFNERLEAVIKFKKLSFDFNIKLIDRIEENASKECYTHVNGVHTNGESLFKSEGLYVIGKSMTSKEEKAAYAKTFIFFNSISELVRQRDLSSETQINEKPSVNSELFGAIGEAVFKVSLCILFDINPGNCH